MTDTDANRKPRLLVLASTYPRWSHDPEPGFVHELAKRLTNRFDVIVLCPHASGAAPEEMLDAVKIKRYRYAPSRLETLVNDGGIVTNLKRAPWKWLLVPGFVLMLAWRAWRLVRTQRPDVIHAHWLLPQGLAVAVLGLVDRRVPSFMVTSHGADLFALQSWPLPALKRFVARRAATLTVVSAAMRDELGRIGVGTDTVAVQSMGVDLKGRFTPDPSVERSGDEILFVGRLVEKKGLRYLIAAMPEILKSRPSAYLTVAGFGPEEAERRLQVAELGLEASVRFIGAVPQADLPALYRRAAVFVAPFVQAASGDREGLGLVSVEAAGCGCPVVTSDLPAVRDVFPGPGMAWFVPPRDRGRLAGSILVCLAQPEGEAKCSRDSLVARFDWGVVSDAYGELLEGCIASRARAG